MKLIVLAAALALPASLPGLALAPAAPELGPDRAMPNAFAPRAGCTPIVRQVAGEKREYRGTRLDEQPPAHLLFAVDREVDGCREATIVRRNVSPSERR